MRDAGGGTRFSEKAFTQIALRGAFGREHVDGNGTIKLHIAREVDRAHSAAAELPPDGVAIREPGAQQSEIGGGCSHVPG